MKCGIRELMVAVLALQISLVNIVTVSGPTDPLPPKPVPAPPPTPSPNPPEPKLPNQVLPLTYQGDL
ncbi:MAG: hypothetical protein ABI684_15855 [Nitrospirota bacterium]